jgi:hypothetical protein
LYLHDRSPFLQVDGHSLILYPNALEKKMEGDREAEGTRPFQKIEAVDGDVP